MTLLWITALAFAAFAVFCLLVWPVLLFGPAYVARAMRRPEMRIVHGTMASLLFAALASPFVLAALVSGGETMHDFAYSLSTLSFGL